MTTCRHDIAIPRKVGDTEAIDSQVTSCARSNLSIHVRGIEFERHPCIDVLESFGIGEDEVFISAVISLDRLVSHLNRHGLRGCEVNPILEPTEHEGKNKKQGDHDSLHLISFLRAALSSRRLVL